MPDRSLKRMGSEVGRLHRAVLLFDDLLRERGVEVLLLDQVGRGRGGPRCMSCPIHRDPLPGVSP